MQPRIIRTLLAAALTTAVVHAEDWSEWRGPGRNGVLKAVPAIAASLDAEPKPAWEVALPKPEGVRKPPPYYGSPVAAGKLYGADKTKTFCFDVAGKTMAWTGTKIGDAKPSPILADGKLILSGKGKVALVDPATGKELGSAKIPVAGCTSVGLAGNKLIVNAGSHLKCYNLGK